MEVFSAKPKSFKLHRKSPLVSKLQSSISDKLLEFLGNYTDHVLAEYITVLVCNGKHQYQARDDLEAFLGEKSGALIAWLWDLLLKYDHLSYMDTGLSDPADTVTSPHDCNADRDSRMSKSKDFQNHVIGCAHGSLAKDNKIFPLSTCNPVASNDMEEGLQCHLGSSAPSEEESAKVLSQTRGKEIPRRVNATENMNGDLLTYKSPEIGGSFVISAGREQSVQYMDNFNKIGKSNCNGMPNQLSHEPVCRNSQSSTSEYDCPRQISDTTVPRQSLESKSVGVESHQVEKSRVSVWDRLGKPNDITSVTSKTVDAHGVDSMKKGGEVLKQGTSMLRVPGGVLGKVPGVGPGCGSDKPVENRQLKHGATLVYKPNAANNIRRKRHFGEINTGPGGTGSDSFNREREMELTQRKISQGFETSILTTEQSKTANPNVASEVLDVKQRLRQIEVEISKLRSKHVEMEKDGKPDLLSHSSASRRTKDGSELRTVTVSNVHFAATKEALLLFFGNCGAVVNAVILTDKATGKPNGSAFVSFASNESVDKAVALSGTTFFSRTIKVSRKSEAAATRSTLAPFIRKPSQLPIPQFNKKAIPKKLYSRSHLQWRRESGSSSLEPSTLRIVEGKGVASSASQQQLPSSTPSVKTSKAHQLSHLQLHNLSEKRY